MLQALEKIALKLFISIFFFLACHAHACEIDVPIEVEFDLGKKPAGSEVGYIMIFAPLKHNGWSLDGVQLKHGENNIPVMKYLSDEEFPGKALFQITATGDFIGNSEIFAVYIPEPTQEGNVLKMMPCLHLQKIDAL